MTEEVFQVTYGPEPERDTQLSVRVRVEDLVKILSENARLRQQVTDLQAASTKAFEERRRTDLSYCVREFHEKYNHPILTTPQVPSTERVQFRLRLITEELVETIGSCIAPQWRESLAAAYGSLLYVIRKSVDREHVDIVDFIDGLTDLSYVVEGSFFEFGVDSKPILREVHRSNCSKDFELKAGKPVKGDRYSPPNVEGELRKQGYKP